MAESLINPGNIDMLLKKPAEKTLLEFMSGLPMEQRVKMQKILDSNDKEFILANKALLAGFAHSASLQAMDANPKLKKGLDELKKKAPAAFATGEAIGFFTPGPSVLGKAAIKASKLAAPLLKLVPTKAGKDVTRFGLESASVTGALEAGDIGKFNEDLDSSNTGREVLVKMLDRSSKAFGSGFTVGGATGALLKVSSLPLKARQKKLDQITRELENKGFLQRVISPSQKQIAKTINVGPKQREDFFNKFGIDIEDAVAGLRTGEGKRFTGTLEELSFQSKITPKGNTAADKALKGREAILNGEKGKQLVNKEDLEEAFSDAIRAMESAKKQDPQVAKVMNDTLNKIRNRFTGKDVTNKDLHEALTFINKQERKFTKSFEEASFDKAAIITNISKGLRGLRDRNLGPEFVKRNQELRALNVTKEQIGKKLGPNIGEASLKEISSRGVVANTVNNLIENVSAATGVSTRKLSDAFGSTSLRSRTLNKFRKELAREQKISREIDQRARGLETKGELAAVQRGTERLEKITEKAPLATPAVEKVKDDILLSAEPVQSDQLSEQEALDAEVNAFLQGSEVEAPPAEPTVDDENLDAEIENFLRE